MPSKSSTPIALRFPNALIAELDALASSRSCSRPEAIRIAVDVGLAALRQNAAQGPSVEPRKRGRKVRSVEPANPATAEAAPAAELELVTFAAQVIEAAQRTETGRFGKDLVFINHVWRKFEREHKTEGMDLEDFKRHLAEASQERFLSLAPAGGARKRERKDVEESETRHLSETFHLVRL
jgi:hypothetical protein